MAFAVIPAIPRSPPYRSVLGPYTQKGILDAMNGINPGMTEALSKTAGNAQNVLSGFGAKFAGISNNLVGEISTLVTQVALPVAAVGALERFTGTNNDQKKNTYAPSGTNGPKFSA